MTTQALIGKVIFRGTTTQARKVFSDLVFTNGVKQALKAQK
jgi:hypothetical protein